MKSTRKRQPNLAAAADFIWRNARLLERHVFSRLFLGGSAKAAVAALLPYQNPDGGFGNGLEPDIRDYLRQAGSGDVVIVPIGFVSDHLEVRYDLDTEARRVCEELGIRMVRAGTVGDHPKFIDMIRELILERIDGRSDDVCAADCCLPAASGRP